MKAELGLPSVKGDDEHGGGMTGGFGGSMGGVGQGGKSKRPISVKFEIPYFTTSGIQVRYLKIIEPKVRAVALSLLLASLLSAILGVPGRRVGIGRAKLVRAIMRLCSGLAFLLLGICFRVPRITLASDLAAGMVQWPVDLSYRCLGSLFQFVGACLLTTSHTSCNIRLFLGLDTLPSPAI